VTGTCEIVPEHDRGSLPSTRLPCTMIFSLEACERVDVLVERRRGGASRGGSGRGKVMGEGGDRGGVVKARDMMAGAGGGSLAAGEWNIF
jgi:hypothetical protein